MGRNTWGWSMGRGVGFMSGAQTYTEKVLALSPIAYWPLNETSGTTADNAEGTAGIDGTYSSDVSGWPVSTGIGDGNTAPTFDAANDYISGFHTGLAAVFDGDAGTISLWSKPADWTGASCFLIQILADANNLIKIQQNNATDRLEFFRTGDGTTDQIPEASGQTSTAWRHVALTWDQSADELKAYVAAVQVGITQTGLVAWAGSGLNATNTQIGAGTTTPTNVYDGNLAHVAIFDSALTQADITELATV